jgi:curved DNA-binding protein CbpA
LNKVLGIPKSSTVEEIKKSYRRLSLIYHPDKKPHGNETLKKYVKRMVL